MKSILYCIIPTLYIYKKIVKCLMLYVVYIIQHINNISLFWTLSLKYKSKTHRNMLMCIAIILYVFSIHFSFRNKIIISYNFLVYAYIRV